VRLRSQIRFMQIAVARREKNNDKIVMKARRAIQSKADSTSGCRRGMRGLMVGKGMLSVAVGLALCAATLRLPATPCVLSNASSPVACKLGCCANKACCKTSHERTGAPSQPFAKSAVDQQNLAGPPATISVAVLDQTATKPLVFSRAEGIAHSLPPLALICIRLI
jgi:hypothetical protein